MSIVLIKFFIRNGCVEIFLKSYLFAKDMYAYTLYQQTEYCVRLVFPRKNVSLTNYRQSTATTSCSGLLAAH